MVELLTVKELASRFELRKTSAPYQYGAVDALEGLGFAVRHDVLVSCRESGRPKALFRYDSGFATGVLRKCHAAEFGSITQLRHHRLVDLGLAKSGREYGAADMLSLLGFLKKGRGLLLFSLGRFELCKNLSGDRSPLFGLSPIHTK